MISLFIVGIMGVFCYDGVHDQTDLTHCKDKPEITYMGSTLGCDIRIEGVNFYGTKIQINNMEKTGKYKAVYCKGVKK
jgi:hypothetical protein